MANPWRIDKGVLRIERCQSIDAVEQLYGALIANESIRDISIPTQTSDAVLGAVGSFVQLIITWAKQRPNGHLIMHDKNESKLTKHLGNLSRTHHGLVALLASRGILSSDRSLDLTLTAEGLALRVLQEMNKNSLGYVTGPELLLLSADATPFRRISQIYHESPQPQGRVRSHPEFVDLVAKWFERLSSIYQKNSSLPYELTLELGTLLYELFKNTDQWATTDLDNCPVERSVRGIRVELTTHRTLRVDTLSEQHQRYIAALKTDLGIRDLLEITIFDSGPGLAARSLGMVPDKTTALAAEYGAVLERLRLRASTSTKSHRGVGLMEVMRALTRAHGFLRIRTGRLALYRDFCSSPLKSTEDLYLFDWFSSTLQQTECGRAEGLLFSILVPVPLAGGVS